MAGRLGVEFVSRRSHFFGHAEPAESRASSGRRSPEARLRVYTSPDPRATALPWGALRRYKEWWRSMPKQSAQPSNATDCDLTYAQNKAEIEIGEIERTIKENQDQPLAPVLKAAIERVRLLTDAEGALLGVCNAWGVVCRASVGKAPDVGSKLPFEPTITSKCIESGRVVICEEPAEEYRPGLQPTPWRLRSVVAVPIHRPGSVLGVLEVVSSRAAAFGTEHIAALEHIAELLVPLLQREEPGQAEVQAGKKRAWLTIAGAVLLVALLFGFALDYRSRDIPSGPAQPAGPSAANPAEASTNSGGTAMHETEEARSPNPLAQSEVASPAPPASSPLAQSDAGPAVAASKPPGAETPDVTGDQSAAVASFPPPQNQPQSQTRAMPSPVEPSADATPPSSATMATPNPSRGELDSGTDTRTELATAPALAPSSPIVNQSGDHPPPESDTRGDVHIQQTTASNGAAAKFSDFAELYGGIPLGKYLEIGKFKDESEANEAVHYVTQAGFHPEVVESSHLFTKFYHVLAGPFGSEHEAEAASAKLESDGFTPRNLPRKSRTLRLGDFEVAWESYSPEAIVKLVKDGTAVKTAPAKWVSRDVPYEHDEILYRGTGQGSRTLLELHFAGARQTLVVADKGQPIVF